LDDVKEQDDDNDDESGLKCMIDLHRKSGGCSTFGGITRSNEEFFTIRGATREKLKSVRAF
jgi:hypothetical protein